MAAISTNLLLVFFAALGVTKCQSFGLKIESKLEDVSATSSSSTKVENMADQTDNLLESNNRLMTTIVDLLQKHDQALQGFMKQQAIQNQIMDNVVGLLQKHDEASDHVKPQLKQERWDQTEESMAFSESNITERTSTTEETKSFTTPTEEPTTAKDCDGIWRQGFRQNGIYTINPTPTCTSKASIQVYCDLETTCGGWTVIQQRFDGSVNFNTNWDAYKNGFGKLPGEHWIGLENLHRLTKDAVYWRSWMLRVELEDYSGKTTYAEYSHFVIGDESTYYKLSFDSYIGVGGNSLEYSGDSNKDMGFSAYDKDHSKYQYNCAEDFTGGWWFNHCGKYSNLNGLYYKDPLAVTQKAMRWDAWQGGVNVTALRRSEMKIRRM